MIQKKKKQLVRVLLITVIIAFVLGIVTLGIHFLVRNKDDTNKQGEEDLSQFEMKRLIVGTQIELEETYNAKYTELLMDGENGEIKLYLVEYNTAEETAEAYQKFKANERIESVDIDKQYTNHDFQEEIFQFTIGNGETISNWGPIVMGLDKMQTNLNEKTASDEIIVAVIDSGFDLNHSIITQSSKYANRILNGFNAISHNDDITDNDGHGTNVGGIVLEATPDNVKIMPIKALDVNEEGKAVGTSASIISAINYAIENDADIINMSLGGETQTAAEQQAIDRAYNKGITCIVASGNGDKNGNALDLDAPGNNCYPAESNHVITVGAVTNNLINITSQNPWEEMEQNFSEYIKATKNDLTKTSFSNYGKSVDFAAPGQWILGITKETEKRKCYINTRYFTSYPSYISSGSNN